MDSRAGKVVVKHTVKFTTSNSRRPRPLPADLLQLPGTLDLSRGAEKFPISVNTHLQWAGGAAGNEAGKTSSDADGITLACALPDGVAPWQWLAPFFWCPRDAMYVQAIIDSRLPVKLVGLRGRADLNGRCGRVLAALPTAGDESHGRLKIRLLTSTGADSESELLSVRLENCMRLLPGRRSVGLWGQQRFRYSAGPVPARFRLQVCRLGSRDGLEYGVRALERIPPEQLVCTYWGISTAGKQDIFQDQKFTVTVTVTEGCVDAQGQGVDVRKVFTLDPRVAGNLARWINCGTDTANLTARLIDHPDGGDRLPLLGLFAVREILVGEELRWNYLGGRCTDARASARPGASEPAVRVTFMKSLSPQTIEAMHKMARHAATGAQHAAHWTRVMGAFSRSGCAPARSSGTRSRR